jgi:hypothetical protein
MPEIDPSIIKALRYESSDGTAGVGFYIIDDNGCPRSGVMQVEMTTAEMVEMAYDLLGTARRLDAGGAYLATMTAPRELTSDDEEALLELLRRHQPPDHQECCS